MKIAFHTLGCKVNQYESEALMEKFKAFGHCIVSETEMADVYIINTCTVTGLADRKSRQFIRRLRNLNSDCILVVIGCYAQLQPEEIAAIPGVNIVAGTNEKAGLVGIVEGYAKSKGIEIYHKPYEELTGFEEIGMPVSMESRTRAYIKIQDGCNRFCTYCIVPYARGNIRSRKMESIIQEAKSLVAAGYKEIILTGINTALYGEEWGLTDGQGLEEVLTRLDSLEGEFRIRLSSLEPTVINAKTVERLLQYKRLCPHFHLSLQSGSDRILQEMKRNYTTSEYLNIVQILKKHDMGFAITTDVIVGFPGETDKEFAESCRIVEKTGFSKVHVFKYSKRSGTVAAEMPNQIPPTIINQRSRELMALENSMGKAFLHDNIGTYRQLLVEGINPVTGMISGYTENYIRAYVLTEGIDQNKWENKFVRVKLTKLYLDGMIGIMEEMV